MNEPPGPDIVRFADTLTVLYRLQRNGRRVTYSVSVTPQGLRLEERLGSKRLVQVNVQTEAERPRRSLRTRNASLALSVRPKSWPR